MFSHFHIIVSGFRQQWADPMNGCSGIEYELKSLYQSADVDVLHLPWHIPAEDFARRCIRYGILRTPCIQMIGYSYGGQTINNMANVFMDAGIEVKSMVMIDPVRRESTFPTGWAASLNRWRYFKVPPNVKKVNHFYQQQNWPRSHRVVAFDPKATFIQSEKLLVKHGQMDNMAIVRNRITDEAAQLHA